MQLILLWTIHPCICFFIYLFTLFTFLFRFLVRMSYLNLSVKKQTSHWWCIQICLRPINRTKSPFYFFFSIIRFTHMYDYCYIRYIASTKVFVCTQLTRVSQNKMQWLFSKTREEILSFLKLVSPPVIMASDCTTCQCCYIQYEDELVHSFTLDWPLSCGKGWTFVLSFLFPSELVFRFTLCLGDLLEQYKQKMTCCRWLLLIGGTSVVW